MRGTSLRVRNAEDSRSVGATDRAHTHSRAGAAAVVELAEQTPRQQVAVMVPLGQQESREAADCEACVALMQSPPPPAAAPATRGA
jgi:hypothetical protein